MYDFKPKLKVRGNFKYLVLYMLRDKPLHGYEIIQKIKELVGGGYEPSPGIIYPTLQLLEDMDYIVSERIERKNVYHITEKGMKFLDEHEEEVRLMIESIKAFREFLSEIGLQPFILIKEVVSSYNSLSEKQREEVRTSFMRFSDDLKRIMGKNYLR